MLTSYFGRYQALYMLPSQYHAMGRTYGPDLVIPTVQRQHVYHPPEQDIFYSQPNLHLQQQQLQQQQQRPLEENSGKTTSSQGKQNHFIDQSRSNRSENSGQRHNSSEIKFSIDRILSNEWSSSIKETSAENVKKDEDRKSGNEEMKTEVSTDTDESVQYEWLHCTRYRPPKLQRAKKKESCKKRKLGRNPRVPFTQQQVLGLERKFGRTHYLSSMDVAELSSALNLSETRVKIWFQNRRARERRNSHSKQTSSQGPDQGEGNEASFVFTPSTSCFGSPVALSGHDASQRSISHLHEALQHCTAFGPLPFRHGSSGT